jgi:hypothetical protein
MKQLESADKSAILQAQADDDHAAGLPVLEGQWQGGGIHVVGPDPRWPEKLLTLHLSDPLATADQKTFMYAPAVEPKVAPAKCVLVERDPVKWAGAVAISAISAEPIQEDPLQEEGADAAQLKG